MNLECRRDIYYQVFTVIPSSHHLLLYQTSQEISKMKVVALISGGKDSCYSMLQCVAAGHEIVALANLQPESQDELDSLMYQTVGHQGITLYAEAMGLPLFRQNTLGVAHHVQKWYTPTKGDEVEDLYNLLVKVKDNVEIEGVASGAVLSDYQRLRVENVCSRLGLTSLAYLWRREQGELLQEMIQCNVDAIVIKVAALGLDPNKHLGMHLQEIQPHLLKMNAKYGLSICGEGGEYETFTVDCPFFKKTIVIDEYETVIHSDDAIAPVGYLNFKSVRLVDKSDNLTLCNFSDCLRNYWIKGPLEYISDLDVLEDEIGSDSDETNVLPRCNSITSVNSSNNNIQKITNDKRYDLSLLSENANVCVNRSGWCWISNISGCGDHTTTSVKNALQNLLNILQDKQYTVSDLISITLWIRDMKEYPAINEAYTEAIKDINPPVRACVQTPLPAGTSVLLEAVAYKAVNKSPSTVEKKTMYVQSISNWAPANIGPYSQADKVGDVIYVAGQIALVPGTMTMIDGSIIEECRLALRHIGRIINAVDQNTLLRDVVQGICYVTDSDYIVPSRREWEKRSNNAIVDYVVVTGLPKDAKVEWHVWAHRGNARFQYEETSCRINKRHKIFLRRRFNYDNTVSAVVCYLSMDNGASVEGDIASVTEEVENLEETQIEHMISYTLNKLTCGEPEANDIVCSLRGFYCVNQQTVAKLAYNVLSRLALSSSSIAFTLVPVTLLQHPNTLLSLCAVRHNY